MAEAILVVKESAIEAVIKELKEALTNTHIHIEIVSDDLFNSCLVPIKDNKVDVDIEISDEVFMLLAKEAHEQDITFNQLVTRSIKEKLDQYN